ncbi:MAG TPA: exonuclease SbcCD subunit D C-terminal domain-containing protein [Saprospiraceae bacterium]|nr:exonuclease SbcCD subunit D C-terminal domain-containing protein [Saprospiraceae bacterium]HMU04606.1 exonuclease SbcCD subunit D C-terminal domain-containing protein [Saprospiraceae bacterium]
MKIVHTADWHIGKILHNQDLHEDIHLFFDWLLQYIKEENIDVLLVSGDIFDLANPANRDIRSYYQMLYKLSMTKTKIIITGGNHDSVSHLDAPSHLLDVLDIVVIGGGRDDRNDMIIPCSDNTGQLECVVLAVPFLRDKELRPTIKASEMNTKSEAISEAIKKYYDELVELTIQKYGTNIPIIAMGHLFMQGSITSDSEREIHVGNLEGLQSDVIHPKIDYMALGHIHKPQTIGNKPNIRYCGSPVFLDFSERDYEKRIIVLDIEDQKTKSIKPINIPKSRELKKITGTLSEVEIALSSYHNEYQLPSFLEVEVVEDKKDYFKIQALDELVSKVNNDNFKILKQRISFLDNEKTAHNLRDESKTIQELTPLEVFKLKLSGYHDGEIAHDDLIEIYMQLLEEIND